MAIRKDLIQPFLFSYKWVVGGDRAVIMQSEQIPLRCVIILGRLHLAAVPNRKIEITVMIEDNTRAVEMSAFCERSEEHTSELQSLGHLVCRLLLEKKN